MNLKFLFLPLIFICGLTGAQNNDSLAAELKKNIPDTSKLKILDDLCWNYSASDLDKADDLALQELKLAEKINDQKYIAKAYNNLGIVLIKKSKFKESLEYQKKALAIRLKLTSELDIASSYSKISYCYHEMADYVNALEASLKALAIYVKLKNRVYEAYTLNTICGICNSLRDFENLKKYASQSYSLSIEIKDKASQAMAHHYLATVYTVDKNYRSAIAEEMLTLGLYRELGQENGIAVAYNNIGLFQDMDANYKEAIPNFLNALDIAVKINDINSQALYCDNIANTYLKLKEYSLCEKYLNRAKQIASAQSLNDILMMVHKTFGDLYAKTNRGEEAVKSYNIYTRFVDTLYSKENAKQIAQMNVKYETEKKESENKILLAENEIKTVQLSKSRITQIFLAIGILLVIIVSYLLYNRTKLKQKEILNEELLKQQSLRSKAVMEAEEKERIRIARELHDGIGQQLSAAKLNISGLQDSIKTSKPEEITMLQNALDLLDESVKEVRAVSHSMVPNALIKSGLISAVREFINKISSSGNLKINLEIVGLNNRLENTVENILFRVLQEVVNNIIKHSKATEVSIQFIKHDNELTILIEDNGVGFVVEKLSSESGIGLKNIQSRVAFLNGEVIFDSYPGKGTTVTIEIPLQEAAN